MAISGFSNTDWELALEPVYGERGFGVTDAGELTGLTFSDYTYTDGVNTSECAFKRDGHGHDMSTHHCGFWAYFANANDQFGSPDVRGVLEGTGRTVLGTQGFRSDKGRVVALYPAHKINNSRPRRLLRLLFPSYEWHTGDSRLARSLRNASGPQLAFWTVLALVLLFLAYLASAYLLGGSPLLTSFLPLISWWLGDFVARSGLNEEFLRKRCRTRGAWGAVEGINPALREKLLTRYPGAQVFSSRAEALKAFPLTEPPKPTFEQRAAALWPTLDRDARARQLWSHQHYATGGYIKTGSFTASQIKSGGKPTASDLLWQQVMRDLANNQKRLDNLRRKYGRYNY